MNPRKYHVLVLTDHRIHAPVDSLYPLLRTMSLHPHAGKIHVASRGLPENAAFFEAPDQHTASVVEVSPTFQWTEEGMAFERPVAQGRLGDYDMVFLRMPRSTSQQLFECLARTLPPNRLMNRPDSILLTGSKAYLVNFPELCPPLRMVHTVAEVEEFMREIAIVLKPLEGSGGRGIVRVKDGVAEMDGERYAWADFQSRLEEMLVPGMLAMKYLENVRHGDKRTIVARGEIVGSSIRKPPAGDWRANVSLGGTSEYAEPDADEQEIAHCLAADLLPRGIALFGFDTLMDDEGRRRLSEINASCVNGIFPAEMHSGKPYIRRTSDLLWEYILDQVPNS